MDDGRRQRRLLLAALAVLALAVVVGGLLLGARMRAAADPRPVATSAVPTRPPLVAPSPRPTPARSLGPADHGARAWDALTGGECLRAFPSAWRPRYDVIACRNAHAAQLTRTIALRDGAYPGRTPLKARLGSTCQRAVRLEAASRYSDVRISSSYPTAARWSAGDRRAFCFVFRAGGGALTGSLAAAR